MKRILAQWINYCNYQTNFCSMPKERVQLLRRYKIEDVLNDLCSFFICVFFFFSFFFNLRVLTIIWIARKPIHFLQQGNVGFYVYFYFFPFLYCSFILLLPIKKLMLVAVSPAKSESYTLGMIFYFLAILTSSMRIYVVLIP